MSMSCQSMQPSLQRMDSMLPNSCGIRSISRADRCQYSAGQQKCQCVLQDGLCNYGEDQGINGQAVLMLGCITSFISVCPCLIKLLSQNKYINTFKRISLIQAIMAIIHSTRESIIYNLQCVLGSFQYSSCCVPRCVILALTAIQRPMEGSGGVICSHPRK